MSFDPIKLLHLSDIHFYESSTGSPGKHRHSLRALRGIEKLVEDEEPDLLLVTGDLTNIGDTLSLDRVYQWIHDKIYVDGNYIGLRLKDKGIPTIIVPGNHDAFDAPSHGSNCNRWQSSLRNYYKSFLEYANFWDPENSVGYRIVEKGCTTLFICYLDSCYLGDPELDHLYNTLSLTKVAKGKISKKQSESIMKLHDQGVRGDLISHSGHIISKSTFLRSIKILVMHHYLFEPSETHSEPLLHLKDRRTVFQNIAMSDFDMLLCGHKHISDSRVLTYLDHFDPRGKVRCAFNQLRRGLGFPSLPLAEDSNGKNLRRMYRFLISLLSSKHSSSEGLTDDDANHIISVLDRSLANPNVLREELLDFLKAKRGLRSSRLFDDKEILALHARIVERYKGDDWSRLLRNANQLRGIVARLADRPFAHVISGSSAKSNESKARQRAVNIYEILDLPSEERSLVEIRRYSWTTISADIEKNDGSFGGPITQSYVFPYTRSESIFQ